MTYICSGDEWRIFSEEATISDFIIHDQKVSLTKDEHQAVVSLSLRNDSKWIESLQFPLVLTENNLMFNAPQIVKDISSKNGFRVFLEDFSQKTIELKLEISANESIYPWIHFRMILLFKESSEFLKRGPEIKLNLRPNLPHINDAVVVNQPTRHNPPTDEWKSNDMPAAYVWNPLSSIETFFFVDFSQMDWMSPETLERFSVYECGLQSDASFGLLHRIPLNATVKITPNFKMVFSFFIAQNYRKQRPNKWDAVESLINRCFKLIPGRVPFPQDDLSWSKFSKECINDLMKKECWTDPSSPKYHAYVMDESELKRRKTIGRKNIIETMTILDILPPWILYLQLHYNSEQHEHVRRACKTLDLFIDPTSNFLYNNIQINLKDIKLIKPTIYSIGDSWYFFEPIARLGWFIRFYDMDARERDYLTVFKVMVNKAKEFVQKHNYEITAFYDPFTLNPLGEALEENEDRKLILIENRGKTDLKWKIIAKNYACLGIYLYIMIEAFYLFNEDQYLKEAEYVAQKFMGFSPDDLFWEPLEIAYGVAGFSELFRKTSKIKYLKFAKCLILNELRMFYWFEDNSFNWKGKRSNLGLVMACVGIRYPAMKENLESTYPWLIYFKFAFSAGYNNFVPKDILKFFNLIRINSFYYFSTVLPDELIYPPRRQSPCPFIPFEDLEMLETPPHFSESQEVAPKGSRTGVLGREIYGAGEVIWLYLMFEALAKCEHHEIMVLNLDLYDFTRMKKFPPEKLTFVAFNPLPRAVTCKVVFNTLENGNWKIKIKSIDKKEKETSFVILKEDAVKRITIEFEVDEAVYIKVRRTELRS